MIAVDEVAIWQGTFQLKGITFEIPTGKYAVLMGATGSGKTTILESIAGLRPLVSGQIFLGGRDVTHVPPGERGVGYVPQDGALFRTMTVYKHLAFALQLRNVSRPAIEQRVQELAGWLGITHLLQRRPFGLSGGEIQRVSLGRALSFRPKYLLLDEPLSALDEKTRDQLLEILQKLREFDEVTALHITHNSSEAERLGDIVLRLVDGRIAIEREG